MTQLNRISLKSWGGKACTRWTCATIDMIVGQIGARHSIEKILPRPPLLERGDIMQALRYTA